MQHMLNLLWPNIFETSPHVINAVMEAIEGMRCCLGATKVLQYVLQGLFHPARKVREVYWKIYNNLYIGSQARPAPTSVGASRAVWRALAWRACTALSSQRE